MTDRTISVCLTTWLLKPSRRVVSINEDYVIDWIELEHDVIIRVDEMTAAKIPQTVVRC